MVVEYISAILTPMQGFFNCCIFLYPKVTAAKSKGGDGMTWCQAVAKAFGSNRFDRNEDKREEEQANVPETQRTAEGVRNSSQI